MEKTNPDRIDFILVQGGTVVTKFWRRDGRDIAPNESEVNDDMELDEMLQWCEANGYTVRRTPQGARAWKGLPWPIRTATAIKRRRKDVMKAARNGWLPEGNYNALDFAYDM